MNYYYMFTKVRPDDFPVFGSLSDQVEYYKENCSIDLYKCDGDFNLEHLLRDMKEKHGDVYFRGIENKNSPSNNGYFENILLKG